MAAAVNRGILYGRASRDPRSTGTSVAKQLDRGRAFASGEGISIVAEIRDDNRSASRGSSARPGFARVRSLIENREADVLILWEVSRSSRDLEEFMSLVNACSDHGLKIAVSGTCYDPAKVDDWLPLAFQGVMAEAEARRIKQRNIDSVETNALKGTPHGRIPYGYRRVYDSKTGVLLAQTPFQERQPSQLLPEAQALADAANAVLRGVTLRQICRDLNGSALPSPRKPRKQTLEDNPNGVVNRWESSTLRQLLLNPTIAGRRVHRGEDIGPATWEPIIEYGTWLQLRNYLRDPARLTVSNPRGPAPRHLLSGIAKCGECGARLKAATNLSRLPRAYTCRAEGCMRVTASADRVDERVEAILSALFDRSDFRGSLERAEQRRDAAAQEGPRIADQIAAKEAEMAAADQLREAGELTLRAYATETRRIEEQVDRLRAQQTSSVASPAVRQLLTSDSLRAGWDAAPLPARREIVKILLDVTVLRAKVRGRRFDEGRVVVTPGPRLA